MNNDINGDTGGNCRTCADPATKETAHKERGVTVRSYASLENAGLAQDDKAGLAPSAVVARAPNVLLPRRENVRQFSTGTGVQSWPELSDARVGLFPEFLPGGHGSYAGHSNLDSSEVYLPAVSMAPWTEHATLEGILGPTGLQLQTVGGVGKIYDYGYAGENDCIYRIRIKKPSAGPDISQKDLDYIAQTLAGIAASETGDPPSHDSLWKYLNRPMGIRRGDTIIAILQLDGMFFFPDPCIIWLQFSLTWWKGEGTGEAGVVSGADVPAGKAGGKAPSPPAGASTPEDCEDWAKQYIAWLKAQGKDPGYSVEAYCGGRDYVFVVLPDGNVHGLHYPPIPGVPKGKLKPLPAGGSGPVQITCPGSKPKTVTLGNKFSPGRKRDKQQPAQPGQPPVWDESWWVDYMGRMFGSPQPNDPPKVAKWKAYAEQFNDDCTKDPATGKPIPGRQVLVEGYDYLGRKMSHEDFVKDGEKLAHNVRLVCLECTGTCWEGADCMPVYGKTEPECDCV